MQKIIETEYKFTLDKEQFEQIHRQCRGRLPVKNRIVQVNYYFDTKNNYYNFHNITIRIRQNPESLRLQIKEHKNSESFVETSAEDSFCIDALTPTLHKPYLRKKVFLKGSLTTWRTEYHFGENSKICFDYSMYLGVCDYEMEIEFIKEDKLYASEIVKEFNLETPSKKSKRARFFNRLKTLK